MRFQAFALLLAIYIYQPLRAQTAKQKIRPSLSQVNWADAELGVIIHLDINIFTPDSFDYHRKETLPPLGVFHPSHLNTDQWIATAKAAGPPMLCWLPNMEQVFLYGRQKPLVTILVTLLSETAR
jgi:alpha-L-fucosidase